MNPTAPIGYGIDLSAHQNPATQPWSKYDGKINFGIVRAAYGAELRDKYAEEHARHLRELAVNVGLYFFFRNIHDVQKQFDLLCSVADSIRLGDGDIAPAIDIELDPFPTPRPVTPEWSGPAEEFASKIVERFGECMIYITRAEWKGMGSPAWVLQRPLWVANYTAAAVPLTPGGLVPAIWQHRVDVFTPNGVGGYDKQHPDVDQNRQLLRLPLIGSTPGELTDDEKARIQGLVALTADRTLHPDADVDTAPERLRAA